MSGPAQEHPEFPVYVYPGTAEQEYPVEDRREYPVNRSAHTYVAADVDNDGQVELISTAWDGVRIFDGTPRGPDPTEYVDLIHPMGEELGVGGVMVGDFDRDGWLDLIVAPWIHRGTEEELENSVLVYFGGPDGYSDDRRMVLPAHLEVSQAILLADVARDGYVDFLYGDADGSIGVYYGGPDGFDRDRFEKIQLPEHNGAWIMGLSAADVDDDGWLELFVTTAGHYTRKASHLYVLRNGEKGYPEDEAFIFDTGGTTGFPAFADVDGDGDLDLLLPFYSTTETRELPARIFLGDGEGGFGWDDPITFDDLPASIAFCPVDLSDNGYPDILVCCHRVDRGHQVDSRLIMNGPDGFDLKHVQRLPGLGPHNLTANNQGNRWDRSDEEYYTSPVFECDAPNRLDWDGEEPFETTLTFRVRFGSTEKETRHATWGDPITEPGSSPSAPSDSQYMQYRVTFKAPGFVNSPRLTSVTIDCE